MSNPDDDRSALERENEELRARIAVLTAQAAAANVDADVRLDALRQSEARYRQLHQTRIDAFVSVSMDGRLQEFNELYQQMVGYDADELRGLTYRDLTPERWHAFEADIVEHQVMARGQSDLYEKEYRRKDGTVFPVELRTILIRDPANGTPAGMAAVVRDVTRRKRGEQALRESEEKFKAAFLTNVDACYIGALDDGTVLEINTAFEELFGYTRDEALGRTSRELGLWVDYADRVRMWDQLRSLGFVKELETRGRRKGGEQFPCSVSTTALNLQGRQCVIGIVRDESQRRRGEQALIESRQALAESQEALVALINSTTDLIWSVEPRTFGLVTFNNGLRDYFALRGIDLRPGMTPADLLPADVAERWRQFYVRALRDGPYVDQYVSASGLPVLLLSLNLVTKAGAVSAISVFGKDITDRIESEEALKCSERRFRTLIEDAPIAIRLGRDGRTLYANRRYLDLYGYAAVDGLLGAPIVDQWAPECRADIADRTRRYEAGLPVPVEYEGIGLRKDGTRVPVQAAVGPVLLPDGPALIAYVTDITDRKRAEEALKHSEERFRQVAETVSDFIWEVDADGLYTYTNQAVEKILGYSPRELVGRKHFYDLFAEDVREELRNAAFQVIAAKQAFRGFPNTNVSKDGGRVHVETSGAPLLDEAGNLVGYRGADTDVSERWLNEQAVRDLTGRLINAQEAERARVARELHDDFSQRLALLAVNLDLLRQSPPEGAEALRAAVNAIHVQVQVLARDVRRMSHDLHPARLEQLGLVSAVRGLCRELSAAHGLSIQCDARGVPRDVPDQVALCVYRVAQEALQNAIKHSSAAAAVVELVGRLGELHLVISDDGRGFDVAFAQRAGSLGLDNMRERVRSIGGRITIESAPGRGTRVEMEAPLG
jgi:PAS domain S-box-containing protein